MVTSNIPHFPVPKAIDTIIQEMLNVQVDFDSTCSRLNAAAWVPNFFFKQWQQSINNYYLTQRC